MVAETARSRPSAKRIVAATFGMVLIVAIGALTLRFTSNSPVRYSDPRENFKDGSTGGEILSGIPYSIAHGTMLANPFRGWLPLAQRPRQTPGTVLPGCVFDQCGTAPHNFGTNRSSRSC